MNQPTKKDKKWLLYLAYITVLTVVFLYFMFPEKALTSFFRLQAENRYPSLNIDFDEITVSLSPGINIYGLKIAPKKDPGAPVYVSEKTSIKPSILSLLTGDTDFSFKSSVNKGEISGYLKNKITNKKESVEVKIVFDSIILDENVFIHPILSQRIEGMLDGKIIFMGDFKNLLRGNTEVSLRLTDGKINLKKPFIELNEIEFNELNISGVIDNRKFNIKDIDITGRLINGSTTGNIQLKDDILSSRLNLKAKIEPLSSLLQENPLAAKAVSLMKKSMKNGKFTINIKGTMDKPSLKFK